MQNKTRSLSKQEQGKFATLVRKNTPRLTAQQLSKLPPPLFSDYCRHLRQPDRSPSKPITREPQVKPVVGSHYYVEGLQVLSMKEFVWLLQESRRKQEQIQKKQRRLKEKQLVQSVSRAIQSSQSVRNLRLTSSSAKRISQRFLQQHQRRLFLSSSKVF